MYSIKDADKMFKEKNPKSKSTKKSAMLILSNKKKKTPPGYTNKTTPEQRAYWNKVGRELGEYETWQL